MASLAADVGASAREPYLGDPAAKSPPAEPDRRHTRGGTFAYAANGAYITARPATPARVTPQRYPTRSFCTALGRSVACQCPADLAKPPLCWPAPRRYPTRKAVHSDEDTALNTAANLLLEQELLTVVRELSGRRIPYIALKGTPLLRRLGLPLGARKMHDNDILVRPEDAQRVVAALATRGYLPAKSSAPLSTHAYQFLLTRGHESGMHVALDVHVRLLSPDLFPARGVDPWEHTQEQQLGDCALRVLDRALTLIQTAAHLAQHAFTEPRILGVLGTAWTAWHSNVDRNALVTLAHETGTFPTLVYALDAARALGCTNAASGMSSVRAAALSRALPPERLRDPRPYPDYSRMVLAWLVLPPGAALRQLRRGLWPSPAELRAVVGADSSLAWAYLERPLRPLMRRLGVEPRGARRRTR